MTNFLYIYGLYFAKTLTLAFFILLIVAGIVAIIGKGKSKEKEKIEITKLNDKFDDIKKALECEILSKKELKNLDKKEKSQEKLKRKEEKAGIVAPRKRIFILNFSGDIHASAVENLREEVTALLTIATPADEVLVCIESSGGMIPNYGLAASQLKRIRDRHIPLIAAVDKVAASGGYMMACVANKIFAAPFAILGSIGVIAQLPNFNRFLKKHDVDFEQIMAGEYKRTLTMFGENTKKGREKFQEEVDEVHNLFKSFVSMNRPLVNIDSVATGEYWYGVKAMDLRLVDDIITSDDYLLRESEKSDLYKIEFIIKKGLLDKFGIKVSQVFNKVFFRTGHL